MANIESLSSIHSGREVIYNLFYRAFIDSPREDLYTMVEELLPNMSEFDGDELKTYINEINNFIRQRANVENDAFKEFDLDTHRFYTRLMCLTDSAPNTESYYTSPEKLAMQDARDKVLKYYADYGLRKDPKYNEHEDFVSNEMRFMSYMANLTAQALEENNDIRARELIQAQLDFLNEHPMRWIPQFAAKINKYKEAERFYGAMSSLMSEFIKIDADFLKELLN